MIKKLDIIFSKKILLALWDVFVKYIPIYLYVRVFHQKKQCWLITERPTDARDNGWVLYKWIRENHPELNLVYAILKSSQDYKNVECLGKVIEYGSREHWYYYFAASICCDTSWGICAPNPLCYVLMRNLLPPKNKRVFLQHGVIKDYMPEGRKNKLNVDVFVCGAYPEWEYISNNFGYTSGEVKYLGLARFDRLKNIASMERPKILYMPTWRASLDKSKLLTSVYYEKIKDLLSSKLLHDLLDSYNVDLIYFLHPAIRSWKSSFEKFQRNNIKIYNNEDCDLQLLLCSSNLLITDFSSIYFDFAYQNKPVVYYQYDYNDYRKGHYLEGYFNYKTDGFGPVVEDELALICAIESFIKNNFRVSSIYQERIERFFPLRDGNNCKRHYDVLCDLER